MDRARKFIHIRLGCALAFCVFAGTQEHLFGGSSAPTYSSASIVQAASQTSGTLAPNDIVTIYGTNLAFSTEALGAGNLINGNLPLSLAEVSVYVNGLQANLFYVSPGQINFLIPYEITSSTAVVFVNRQGTDGPQVTIELATTAPAFFQWNGNFAVAEHANGSLISPAAPASAGEVIVLFAAGLGRTSPDVSSGVIIQTAVTILYASQLQVLLNGVAVPAANIYYAGATPGFAGLYQVNVQLPEVLPPNPQIQLVIGSQASPAAIQLSVQ